MLNQPKKHFLGGPVEARWREANKSSLHLQEARMQIPGFIHFGIIRDELGSELQTLCGLWRQTREGCMSPSSLGQRRGREESKDVQGEGN